MCFLAHKNLELVGSHSLLLLSSRIEWVTVYSYPRGRETLLDSCIVFNKFSECLLLFSVSHFKLRTGGTVA